MKFVAVYAAISAIAVANGQKHRHSSSIRRVLQADEPMSMSMILDPNKKGTSTTKTTGTTGKSSSRSKMGGGACSIDGFWTAKDICTAAIPPEVDSSCDEE